MKIAIVGGGPGGPLLRRPDEAARPAPRDHRLGAQRRPTTRSASASSSPTRPSAASRTPTRSIYRADGEPVRPLDRHRRRLQRRTPFTVGGQGFAAMSRKELLRILQERCRRARRRPCTSAPRRPTSDELQPDVRPRGRRRRAQLRGPRPSTPTSSAHPGPRGTTSTCGSAPTWSSRRSSSSSRRREWGTMQIHGYPYSDAGLDLHRRDARGRLAPRRLRRDRGRGVPARRQRRVRRRADPGDLRRGARRATSPRPTTPSGSTSPRSATSAGTHGNVVLLGDAAHTAHFSIGSGTKLAMEDALALAACLHEHPTRRGGARRRTRPSAGRWWSPPSAPRRPRWSGSRTSACTPTRTLRSSCFNLLTRSRRITFENLKDARPGVRGADGGGVRAARRAPTRSRPAMFQPYPDRRAGAEEPRRSSRRWTCTRAIDGVPGRLPPGPPRLARPSAAPGW